MKLSPQEMSDEKLLETWKIATNWTSKRMQVTGTNKNELGELYNHDEFMIALDKIEKLEDEMQKRGIIYG